MHRIFGPVPSRRLGRSLGVDVIPHKTCTFDCVYCECGPTTNKTCERKEFFPLEELLSELRLKLSEMQISPDVITLSGAGEPTLYSRMGELIARAKDISGLPVAVITNSSLMHREDVREELMNADIVLPSLDSAIERSFVRINRPHRDCKLSKIIEGLRLFLNEYRGKVLFEILLVEGYNTSDEDLKALKEVLGTLKVDRIQLNTVARPGTIKELKALSDQELERIREFFGPSCEIVSSSYHSLIGKASKEDAQNIITLLERRPCTLEDIHNSTGIPVPGLIKLLEFLKGTGKIDSTDFNGKIFYIYKK